MAARQANSQSLPKVRNERVDWETLGLDEPGRFSVPQHSLEGGYHHHVQDGIFGNIFQNTPIALPEENEELQDYLFENVVVVVLGVLWANQLDRVKVQADVLSANLPLEIIEDGAAEGGVLFEADFEESQVGHPYVAVVTVGYDHS